MTQTTEILVATTTVGSMDDAKALARKIIDARLAACVQLDEIKASVYRWEGKTCEEAEVRLTIKTLLPRKQALIALVQREHPYDLPQLTWATMACTPEYGAWVAAEASG